MEMLAVVVLGLVVVVIGLRWVSRFRKPEEVRTPEQKFVERVHKVLDEVEKQSQAGDDGVRRN
jgi:membrane protein implicated in regulation of membrane protease activity